MQRGQQESNNGNRGNGSGINHVELVLHAISLSVVVFLHRRFGARYIGLQGVVAIPVIAVFEMIVQAPGAWALTLFLLAYIKACIFARVSVVWRDWRGQECVHSRYNGWPYLMKVFPRLSELTVKQYVEPLVVFLVGLVFMCIAPALGYYLFIAALALFITVAQAEAYERRRTQIMHDAVIEAQQRAERFRAMNGRR